MGDMIETPPINQDLLVVEI